MKKILLLGLNGRGGTLHYASHISSGLSAHADVSLLLPSYSDTSLVSKKVKLIRINAPPNVLKTILLTFNVFGHVKAVKVMNAFEPDIIDVLDIHPWYLLYWPFLKAKRKMSTINDPELHSGEAGAVMSFLIKLITKFLMRRSDELIVLGKKQEETIKRLGYRKRIIVSKIGHYGFFSDKVKRKYEAEPRTLLFFGRIKDYKGIGYLLDALIILKKQGVKFRLIIAGEGEMEKYADKLEALKGDVELHIGYVPDEKVGEYFQRAEFTMMPYTDATQTGIVQVSYSFRKPIIATRVGSLPELVIHNKTGLIVEPKNVRQLAKAIKQLLDDREGTRKKGEAAFSFMNTELDWKRISKALYSDMTRGKA